MKTLGKKLNNPFLQTKTYWSVLKTSDNDKNILLIPHLLIGNKFVNDIKTKTNLFNMFFC